MPPLPPTVGERLVKCETQVEVWGIVTGANVDLLIDGVAVLTQNNVTGWGTTFTLAAPLVVGNRVTARQTVSGTPSSESPEVVVGDVDLPPPPPRLAPSIYRCANCVYADGMAPGSTLTIFQGQDIDTGGHQIAQTTVGRDGTTCFSPGSGFADNTPIFGVATTCGINSVASPDSGLVDISGPLPAPSIHSPIYGCQTAILMEGLTQGASIEVFADHVSLGSFCNCWGAVNVNLGRGLTAGEGMSAKQTMVNAAISCAVDGVESTPAVVVVPPDAGIKPGIRPVLYDSDRLIRVTNQISGGQLTVFVQPVGGAENNVGDAGSSQFEEIALNDPLVAGQIVRVTQTLCGRTESSDPLTVQPRPGSIQAPVVRSPLYSCGVLVAIDGLLTGAQVRVFQNGFPVGFAWADGPSITVRIGPSLVTGKAITATQRVGGVDSLLSAPVTVLAAGALPLPVLLGPVVVGGLSVQVGGIVPGAYVQVFDRGALVGTADAVEATVAVPLSRAIVAASDLRAAQTLCGNGSGTSGPGPSPITDPSTTGPFTPSTPADTPGTTFSVPASADAGPLTVTLTGELTFPEDPANPGHVDPSGAPYPLVIIAHGNHDASSPSYQGYRYLANLLVSQGVICFSANLNDLNGSDTNIDARGLVILQHIRILVQRSATAGDLLFGAIDPSRVGLVGHSRGAEGVVDAQVQNLSLPPANRLNIRGVVPIAPTNFLNRSYSGAPLFVIYGSFDADVSGAAARVNPFFIYDHAQPPKAMIFIHHARHNGFNEVWVRPAEENETRFPGVLSPAEHQAIAKAYISAFFQSTLFGRAAYEVFLQGAARPSGLGGYSIHNQYQVMNRQVVDNFGDADAQLGIARTLSTQRETNTLNQAVTYTEAGMTVWFDAEMSTVSNNPHDSRGGQLSWAAADNYVSNVDTRDFSGFAVLSVRLGQQFSSGSTLNPNQQPQDLLIRLKTTGGDATVRVGSITDLPFPDQRPDPLTKAALKTVRVPLAAFTAINPAMRLNQVTGIELDFPLTRFGAISVDDIEFSA